MEEECLTKSKLEAILSVILDYYGKLNSTLNASEELTSNSSHLVVLFKSLKLTTTPTIISDVNKTSSVDVPYEDDRIDIVTPFVVGIFVAMILGWMLIRYKMSAHERSNYSGSIYCCPNECFDFCARFARCKIKIPRSCGKKAPENNNNNNSSIQNNSINSSQLSTSNTICSTRPSSQPARLNPQIIISTSHGDLNFSEVSATSSPILKTKKPTIASGLVPFTKYNGQRKSNGLIETSLKQLALPLITTTLSDERSGTLVQQIPTPSSLSPSPSFLHPARVNHPLSYLKRESISVDSSRRGSHYIASADLMKSGGFLSLFHSFKK